MRLFLLLLGVAVIAVPAAILVTLLTWPFWSWFEAATGIESFGHSGPAEWCYAAMYVVLVAIAAAVVFLRHRQR
jgi:hypothetical protein